MIRFERLLISTSWMASVMTPLIVVAADRAVPMTNADQVSVSPYCQPVAFEGRVFFCGTDRERGSELWVSDGTRAGTHRLKDIWPGPNSSAPYGFMTVGTRVLFWANDGIHGDVLWATDGTEAGTTVFERASAGDGIDDSTELPSERPHSTPSSKSSSGRIRSVLVRDEKIGRPELTAHFNSKLFFFADGENGLPAVYGTDGTAEGTGEIISNLNGPGELLACEDGVFVFQSEFGTGLWKTNGDPLETSFVPGVKKWRGSRSSDLFAPDEAKSRIPIAIGRTMFFVADDDTTGVELWRTDGTEVGTRIVRDIRKGWSAPGYGESDRSAYPLWLTVFNNEIYFAATDDVDTDRGRELWKTDGTEAGTVMVKDLNPGRGSSDPASLIVWNNALYFTAITSLRNREQRVMWKSDGTEKGTVAVRGVAYAPSPPAYVQPPHWPLSWPLVSQGCLYTSVNPYDSIMGVGRMKPGSHVITMLFGMPNAEKRDTNQMANPRWVRCNDAVYFVAAATLWKCVKP